MNTIGPGDITLHVPGAEAYAVMNDSVMNALFHDPDHKSQPAKLDIMVPEDMTWPFWMIVSADGTTRREPDQRQAKYFIKAFEVAQDLANQIRDGSVKIPAMPPELADLELFTCVLHTHQEPDQSLSYHVDVTPHAEQTILPKSFGRKNFQNMKITHRESQAMNVINSVTNSVHLDWHAAGEPTNFEQAYSRNGFHFLVRVNRADDEDSPWTTTIFGVSRQGDDPSTDVVNFEQSLYDCVLEQSPGCDHPTNQKAVGVVSDDVSDDSNRDHKSNVELLDQAHRQVMNAVIAVSCYDDKSATLTYHTEQLESAQRALTQVRKNLRANANSNA